MTYLTHPLMNRSAERHVKARLRTPALIASVAAVAVLGAACGSSQSSSTTTTAPAAGSGGSTSPLKLESATVANAGSVLTGPNGMTLYYFTTDTAGATSCTGQCAVLWPPLLVSAGSTPTLPAGVSGTLTTVKRPDGTNQLSYKGHLLYYYQGDTAPSQDKGQGLDGTWFVLSTSGTTPTGSSTATTTPAGGAGGVGF